MNANVTAGTPITVTLTDGATITGTFVSINTKGINVKTADGKTVSRSLTRVVEVVDNTTAPATDDLFSDMDDDAVLTTAELAAIFDTNAKALRVELRRLALGVGKGRTYALTPATIRPLVTAIRDGLVARAS
jgi:hypothetical protein